MTTAKQLADLINKQLGNTALKMGSDDVYSVKYLSTGLLPFDVALGGGIPYGRFVECTGAYSTLKSYVGLHAIARCQHEGKVAALLDTEHAYDKDWAEACGVDTKNLIVWPDPDDDSPHNGEEAVDTAEILVRNGVGLIVFDSVAAALPQQEANKRLATENIQPARLAALMSAACRRLTAANSRTAIFWINQLREQVGVTFGPTERPTAGRALGYYASMRMNVRMVGKETRDRKTFTGSKNTTSKELIAQEFKITIEKSKLNRPWREVFFSFNLLEGGEVDITKFIFAQCVEMGIVTQKGSTWQYNGFGNHTVVVRGKEKFLQQMKDDEMLRQDMETAVREAHSLPAFDSLHGGRKRRSSVDARLNGSSPKKEARGRTRTAVPDGSSATRLRRKSF